MKWQQLLPLGALMLVYGYSSYPAYPYYGYAPYVHYPYNYAPPIVMPYYQEYIPDFPPPALRYPSVRSSSSSSSASSRSTNSSRSTTSHSSSSRSQSSVSSNVGFASSRGSDTPDLTSSLTLDGLPCFSWVWCPKGN